MVEGAGTGVHPVENIRGAASSHLAGRKIVLGVCGSIAAVKTVELARELIRHGADVQAVMTDSATRIIHPDALHFATGHAPIIRLTGAVEHVALLGDVPGKADLLLIAPATANTVSKMALGIDDSAVTTCATVAFGTRTPVVVAPAMHEAMLEHPIVADHRKTLTQRLGVTWVEPLLEEKKAKLADIEAIVESVIHRLASDARRPGPLAGKRALVISGATEEPIDPVRILTNRSSGLTGILIATELRRLGATVTLWQGHATTPVPAHLEPDTTRYATHQDLVLLLRTKQAFDHIWMPAAIGDYSVTPAKEKIASEAKSLAISLKPLPKIIESVRKKWPKATLVAFKAESDEAHLLERARDRLRRYGAQFVVANGAGAFGATDTTVNLVDASGVVTLTGPKTEVLPRLVALVAGQATPKARTRKGT